MSVFKNLFAKKETTPTSQEAIQKIREVEDLLNKKSEYLEKKIADELDAARKHGTKNKRRNFKFKRFNFYHKNSLNLF